MLEENSNPSAGNAGAEGIVKGISITSNTEHDAKQGALKGPGKGFSKLIDPNHKRLSRMLGYCLTLGDADAWAGFSFVAEARLSEAERAGIAWASLRSLEPYNAEQVAVMVLGGAGYPLPLGDDVMGDAQWWASMASEREAKAYCLASFNAMPPHSQAAFLSHVDARAAA